MPIPFESFKSFDIQVETPLLETPVSIHGVRGGSGPPLLLLHGNPQTHYIWHLIAPELADHFTVVATDLRGYGASSKPAGDEKHVIYSFREMAKDQIEVMKQLGFSRFLVLAHDRGARVAHRMAIDFPDAVEQLVLLDIAPTLTMYEETDMKFATAYYHWFFLIQPAPFPETMISAAPLAYLYSSLGKGGPPTLDNPALASFSPQALDSYVEAITRPGTIHAICEDYRASATIDLEHDRLDRKEGRTIKCPLKVYWGTKGYVGVGWKPLDEWAKVTEEGQLKGGSALPSGHYIPEHAPQELLKEVMGFLKT